MLDSDITTTTPCRPTLATDRIEGNLVKLRTLNELEEGLTDLRQKSNVEGKRLLPEYIWQVVYLENVASYVAIKPIALLWNL